ncbi:MAG: SusC/RagA family TonB-linked outer membrane protein [Bacteroidales bacterium]|nr:SusC/RagA family TonB-linked outer membrane protein [Bacteroidales bacterium]
MGFSGIAWADSGTIDRANSITVLETQKAFQVSGKVSSSVDGSSLPGVSVVVKGTGTGVITNTNGDYSINVAGENSILRFSFIGYEAQEILVGNRQVINIVLDESIQRLEEVVVTALGITRQEKSLGYAVGKVDGEEMNRVTRENVISSLAGKVAGVTINSTGGTGSSVSMVIRGATSLSSDNQPLFVVDGVPMINALNNVTQFGERNIVDYGNAISDLNPDDIESVSILKGPSAAALYGSRAGNGVVLITTKRGNKKKGVTVSITSNTVFDNPYKYFETQRHFSTGYFSFTPDNYPGSVMVVDPAQGAGAGIECDKGYFAIQWHSPRDANGNKVPIELVSYPNNIANFVQTGISSTNGVSVSSNSELINYRLGVTSMSNRGIIPNSDLFRNNFSVGTDIRATEKLTISSNLNVNKSWSNNRPSSNRGTNPLEWAYKVPLNVNILDLEDYWEPGQEGVQQRTPANGIYNNPYFLANEVNNSFNRDRFFGNMKAVWQITPELSLMGRYSIDRYDEKRETKISPSYTREPNNGAYGIVNINNYEGNTDFLATYNKQLNKFAISVSAGGNSLYRKGSTVMNSSKPSTGLIVTEVYSISNIKSGSLNYASSWYQKAIYSLYGMANLSYNNMIYLDLTARNDWSSTLPKEHQSYFYPSASLSVLLNEMFEVGDMFDLLKMRGGWAKVGNDANPYQLYQTYGNSGQWGEATRLSKSGTILTPDLKPEEATSWEIGTDIRIARDRIRIEGTYYSVENRNQIIRNIPIASSSGYSSVNINAGLIESKGWEFLVGGTPIRNNDLVWNIDVNFSRNRTKLIEISEGIDFIEFWRDARGGAKTYVGDNIGDIYDATLLVVEDENSPYYGYPIVGGENLRWQDNPSQAFMTKIGNYNPDFMLGLQSGLTYKGFSLNMTFDWRKGGQFVSQTHRYMSENKNSQQWLDQMINPGDRTGEELRDWLIENEETLILNGFHVIGGPTSEYGGFPEGYSGVLVDDGAFIPGVILNADGTYSENLGEEGTMFVPYIILYPWEFTKSSTFDADFIKLREISLTYQIPSKFTHRYGIQDMMVSVYSRNIILWTKAKIGIDPERAFQAEASGFKQGIERYNLEPWVMPIGLKLNLTF